jgi:O-antigen ligase
LSAGTALRGIAAPAESGILQTGSRVACYALSVTCVWSIAATEAAALCAIALGGFELARSSRGAAGALPPASWVWPLGAVLASAIAAALANEGRVENLRTLGDHYRLLLPLALLPVLARIDRRRWLSLLAVGVILSGLYGALQFFEGVDWVRAEGEKLVTPATLRGAGVFHAKGSYSHHLTYAGAMLVHLAFFAALYLDDRGRERWLWLAAALAALAGVALSMGRSGWIGAAVGIGVLFLRLPRRIGWPLLGAGLCAALLISALLWSGTLARAFDDAKRPALLRRLLVTSFAHDKDRLYLWEAARDGFLANPVFGIGSGNDRRDFAQWRNRVAARHGGHRYLTRPDAGAHNLYLQLAYETGALGLAAHLAWTGAILVWCRRGIARSKRIPSLERGILFGCAAGLTGSLAAAFFENNFLDAEVQVVLLLSFALALDAGLRLRTEASESASPSVPATE